MDPRCSSRTWALVALAALAGACSGGAPSPPAAGSRVEPAGASRAEPPAVRGEALPFTDVTRPSGVDFVHFADDAGEHRLPEEMGSGGALFDYDGDGDLDLYLVQGGRIEGPDREHRNVLYRNDGHGRFEDVSAGSGADLEGVGMGCAAADYDGDGDVDLYVTRLGPDALLRNDGRGRFEDVTVEAGVATPGFSCSAAFLDFDRDGNLDLFVVRYVDWASHLERPCFSPMGERDYCNPLEYDSPTSDRLYRGLGNGRFEDVTEASGLAAHRGNGLGVVASDLTGDGWPDLFVANDQTPGFLHVNQGDGTFVEDAAVRGCAFSGEGLAIAGMGVVAEDLDGDADFDLVVTNIHDQAHLALRNDGGRFTDLTHRWGFGGWGVPYTGFGIVLFDQDHDSAWDGFVANGAVNRLSEPARPDHDRAEVNQFVRQADDGRFRAVEPAPGSALSVVDMSRAVLKGDLDGDGDLDLVVTNNRGPVQVLRNEAESSRSAVLLDLRPRGTARHAIGARVELRAGSVRKVAEMRAQDGYLTSHDPRLHFGLGAAELIDELTVHWVDGSSETWNGLPARGTWVLRQGQAPAAARPELAEPSGGGASP